jgi:hypothetical protein
VALPAGRLVWNAPLPDSMRDAEIRILPSRTAPGRAAKFFVAPAADDFSFPQTLASATTRVVWSDLGLPRTAVSVERLLVDLVEGPIGLQLEWPRGNAVAMLQSLDAVARAPAFEFFQSGDCATCCARCSLRAGPSRPQCCSGRGSISAR